MQLVSSVGFYKTGNVLTDFDLTLFFCQLSFGR